MRRITRRDALRLAGTGALAGLAGGGRSARAEAHKQPQHPSRPPNIVWIWADNLAWQDLSCYGSKTIRTPHIDRLAGQGVRLTQYYIAHAVCSPSRLGLLTGRQPWRAGITDVLRPDSPTGIPDDEITLAEALKARGYATMAIGKWHLGDRPVHLPTRHGFDGYLGLPYSMDMLPTILLRDEKIIDRLGGKKVADITERYTAEAIRFVKAHRDKPFFLYLSHTIPHPPLNIPASRRTEGRSIYADAVEYLDEQTGALLKALDDLGLADNTLVVFTSDNGPMARDGDAGPLRGRIRSSYEGGVRVPFVARFPGRIPKGTTIGTPVIAYDMFPTFVRLAGAKLPEGRVYDGQDVWPVLTGRGTFQRRAPFVWVYDDNVTSVRDGRWKLHVADRTRRLKAPQLYDVQADPGEKTNLATKHPDVLKKMLAFARTYEKQIPKVWTVKYPVRDPAKRPSGIRRE